MTDMDNIEFEDYEVNTQDSSDLETSNDFVSITDTPIAEEFSRWRLEFRDILLDLYSFYTGQVKVGDKFIQLGERLLSDDATYSLLGYLRTILNKSVVLADLRDYEINNLSRKVAFALALWIVTNANRYNINPKNWGVIFVGSFNIIYTTLTRARMGGERESLVKTISVSESIHKSIDEQEREESQKPKFFFPFIK